VTHCSLEKCLRAAQTLFLYADRPENKRTPIFRLQTRHLLIRTTPAKVEISLQSHLEEAPGPILKLFPLSANRCA